ncbi:hypothetical protein G3545_07030 [Starkeya sp. ORNL1]|uniref:hypothetical protein n=1 Tax=Starkeya sp. ORNL1 TaxID=2709380 RepID=UPI0014632EBC|nr:hypothetical protein [Starkeya sp. ORNL1]QJP13430.1 hypothetical protein G3545_07030 [Starkeya sp. ORNL1]
MLETLFVVGFVVLPLAIAVVLILYRARFVVIGIAVLVVFLMLIWAVLTLSALVRDVRSPGAPSLTMPGNCTDPNAAASSGDCRL